MKDKFHFTFTNLRGHFKAALDNGYGIIACRDYVNKKQTKTVKKIFVNRVDIDVSCKKAKTLAAIFNDLGIKATFFVRLHGDEYNPFSFENYRCLKYIRDSGHEIGLHSEVVDTSVIWKESAEKNLKRDISLLNTMLDTKIVGVASHRGMTGLNNLDFWKDKKPSDFKILYEAYDRQPQFGLFYESFFVSDSNWTSWKCYDKGVLKESDKRTLGEHCKERHKIIYSLIHPETYFEEHFYE